jgi:hypothetical protein
MAKATNPNDNWRDLFSDPAEQKVFEGLADPKWDFRRIGGLARDTQLPEEKVKGILAKYPELVRESLARDLKGQELFTLKSHSVKAKVILAHVRNFLAKSLD